MEDLEQRMVERVAQYVGAYKVWIVGEHVVLEFRREPGSRRLETWPLTAIQALGWLLEVGI